MKNLKKILVTLMLTLTVLGSMFAFSGCSSKKVIGIIQFGTHESLNNCYEGIVDGLKDGLGDDFDNYQIKLENSNFDASASGAQANALVNQNVEMIAAIATPSAMAAANAAKGQLPVIYCAVSDPVAAGLNVLDNVAGTSDLLDYVGQLELIKSIIPSVKKVGVLYCTTEANSESQLAALKTIAENYNVEIVSQSITNVNEIQTATTTLLNKGIDCITNLTDNTVVGALDIILELANAANIPVFGSEIEQVKKGCVASASLDYVALGRQTGLLMAQILKGHKTADKTIYKIEDSFYCYNSEAAERFDLTVNSTINNKTVTNVIEG